MNVKQLLDTLQLGGNKRVEIFTPNPRMDWQINEEHWIEKVEYADNKCIIYAEYWEAEGREMNVDGLLLALSQTNQTSEIQIYIPNGEDLYIKDIENTSYALKIYAEYPYSY